MRDGGNVEEDQVGAPVPRSRIACSAATTPSTPPPGRTGYLSTCSTTYAEEALQGGDDDDEGGDPMDPTPEVGSGTSP